MKRNIIVLSMILCAVLTGQVFAQANLALDGMATASSEYSIAWSAAKGIDDNTGTGYHSLEITGEHWYEVDLRQTCQLSRVEMVNRGDFLSRLNGAVVKILAADRTVLYVTDPVADSPASVTYDNEGAGFRNVRFLRVEKNSDTGPLTIMELRAIDAETAAVNVAPVDGATGILVDKDDTSDLSPTLKWAASGNVTPEDISGYFLYIGTDRDAIVMATQGDGDMIGSSYMTATTYQHTADLEKDAVYYWRVDTRLQDDPNSIIGDVWSFGTELTLPQIDLQPASQIVPENTDGVFTIEASDPLGGDLLYQWWVDPNEGDAHALTEGADYVGVDTPELTVKSVAGNDVGMYYCVVTNATNPAKVKTTNQAELILGKLIGHWPFDGNLTDIAAGNNAVNTGEVAVVYDAGIVGDNAYDSEASAALAIDNTLDTSSWTFSWWENAAEIPGGQWESMLAAGPSSGYENFEFNRYNTIGYAHGVNGSYVYYPAAGLARQQWVFQTVTYDQYANLVVWYVNGVKLTSFNVKAGVPTIDELIFIGNTRDGGQPYNGLLDDLKLYNYPLDAVAVATAYTDVAGGWVCTEYPAGDFNEDCIVDIVDLSTMATDWLASGFFPL